MPPWAGRSKPSLAAGVGLGHFAPMAHPDLEPLAVIGAEIAVRVSPRASRDQLDVIEGEIRIRVTAPPEDGKANKAVRKILAKALGVAPTRLTLIRGETARQKLFRLD